MAAFSRATREVRPFGIRDKAGYMMGDLGSNLAFAMINSYQMLFYLQHIGIRPLHYSVIILIAKLWDGINDPIIGGLVDRAPRKPGRDKFKPWILIGAIALMFTSALVFFDTSAFNYTAKLAWCLVSYVLFDMAYTLANVPYGSMNAAITPDPVERAQLSTWRVFGQYIGLGITMILVPIIGFEQEQVGGTTQDVMQGGRFFPLSVVLNILGFVCFILLLLLTTERVHSRADAPRVNFFSTFVGFFRDRNLMALMLASFAQILFVWTLTTTSTLVFQLYYKETSWASLAILVALVPVLVSAPLVKPLVKRFGKRWCCTWPFLISVVGGTFLVFVPIRSPLLFIILTSITNLGSGLYNMVQWSMISDNVDMVELETGSRPEGSIYATYTFTRKIAQGLSAAMLPALIALVAGGMDMNNPATWNPIYGDRIRMLGMALPTIGCLLCFLFFRFMYTLEDDDVRDAAAALAARHESAAAPVINEE